MATRQTFQLLKFPSLVLTEIICLADPNVLVRLSSCSRKMHHLIKLENRKFSRFAKLHMHSGFAEIEVSKERFAVLSAFPIALSAGFATQNVVVRGTDVLSTLIDGIFSTYWEDPEQGCKEIMEYVSNLYGLNIHTLFVRHAQLWMIEWVQARQTVVQGIAVDKNEELTAEEYLQLMRTSTTEKLYLMAPFPANFNTLDPFRPRQCVYIDHGSWIRREHLLRMDIAEVYVSDSTLNSSDLNLFLKHWLGGGLNRLRTAVIHIRGYTVLDTIMHELAPNMTVVEHQRQYVQSDGSISIIEAGLPDIKRSDGKIGTIQFQPHTLHFMVWPDHS